MSKKRKFRITGTFEFELELDAAVVGPRTLAAVRRYIGHDVGMDAVSAAKHLGYNVIANHCTIDMIDGFANHANSRMRVKEIDWDLEAEEIER